MIYKRYHSRGPTSLVVRVLKSGGLPLFLAFRLPHARFFLSLPTFFLKPNPCQFLITDQFVSMARWERPRYCRASAEASTLLWNVTSLLDSPITASGVSCLVGFDRDGEGWLVLFHQSMPRLCAGATAFDFSTKSALF